MNDFGNFDPTKPLDPPPPPPAGENDAVRDKREKSVRVPVLWGGMDAVKEIADRMIPEDHPHLAEAEIRYICRNKAAKKAGQLVPGKAFKMSRMYKYLTGCDFVIEVALEVWNHFNPNQRVALVDHLLAHCRGEEDEKTGEMKWSRVTPDIGEFPEVAERRGQWHEGLVELEKCLRAK